MDDQSTIDRLLKANESYAARFELRYGNLPAAPSRRVAVLTCMDARMHPERFLGLDIGDAHVIRNAGGRASEDAIRSLVISSLLLGTREFLVIHHTRCGMQSHTNEQIRHDVAERLGADASNVDFLPFTDLDDSVREDVRRIRESPLIGDDIMVRGFVYEVESGRLRPVE